MKTGIKLLLFVLFVFLLFNISCSDEEDLVKGCTDPLSSNYNANAEENEGCTYALTQGNLDAVSLVAFTDLTGTQFGEDGAHDGSGNVGDSTFRDIFTNVDLNTLKTNIPNGTIITKHVYGKNSDGSKGKLKVAFAMIKHPTGYFADGGDFEYFMIPDSTVNNEHPYGLIPDEPMTQEMQKMMCADCHKHAEGNDYLFIN